jgi:molybdate transport system substrate-binding protein
MRSGGSKEIMRRTRAFMMLMVMVMLALGMTPALRATEINAFAAASLTEGLKQIASAYERESGDRILFNFAASSLLARQIEEGAPADIFFSADELKMDALEAKGLIRSETRLSRLSNSLVIVVAKEGGADIATPQGLASDKVKRIALGEPATVPAGIYAREYLQKKNLWTAVRQKVIPTENVRAALAAVEAGDVEAGIVYKTDAAIAKKVKIAYEVPAADAPTISYPMAVLKHAKAKEASERFMEYLKSKKAARIFERFGFIVRE